MAAPTTVGKNDGICPNAVRANGSDSPNIASTAADTPPAQRRSPTVAGALAIFSIARESSTVTDRRFAGRGG